VSCQVCSSTLRAGDLFCSACGAVVPNRPARSPAPEPRGRIAGERKFLTVLCSDLQRSTDLISELDPEEAISRLEPALIAMRTAVRRNRGIVSKEGGDGLIALFGAPHADDNHAVMACHAAVELVRRIKLLEDPGLHVRVGIHSGYVVTHVIEADFVRKLLRHPLERLVVTGDQRLVAMHVGMRADHELELDQPVKALKERLPERIGGHRLMTGMRSVERFHHVADHELVDVEDLARERRQGKAWCASSGGSGADMNGRR